MAPPARQTKSAACALTTRTDSVDGMANVRSQKDYQGEWPFQIGCRDQDVACEQRACRAQQRRSRDFDAVRPVDRVELDGEFAGRVLDGYGLACARRQLRQGKRNGARDDACGGDGDRAQHADRLVADVRDECPRRHGPAFARRGDQRHLGHDAPRDVAKVHPRTGGEPDRFELRLERRVRVEFRRRLVAGSAEIARRDDDHGHPVVDAGDRDPCDDVLRMPGREQRAATAAFGADESEQDRRRRPRHAADARVAV